VRGGGEGGGGEGGGARGRPAEQEEAEAGDAAVGGGAEAAGGAAGRGGDAGRGGARPQAAGGLEGDAERGAGAAALVRQAQVLAGQAGLREGGLRLAGLCQEDGRPGRARGCGGEGGWGLGLGGQRQVIDDWVMVFGTQKK